MFALPDIKQAGSKASHNSNNSRHSIDRHTKFMPSAPKDIDRSEIIVNEFIKKPS